MSMMGRLSAAVDFLVIAHFLVLLDARPQCQQDDAQCRGSSSSHLRFENLHYEVISERPRIYFFPDFLSDEECDSIRGLGLPHVAPSKTDAGLTEHVRSSKSYFFSQEQERSTPAIMAVKHRASAISRVTLEYQEELQIQHYEAPREGGSKKDFYIPHFDWIPSRPRVATLLIYLEAPDEGGETIFPLVRHNSSNRNAQLLSREAVEPMTLNMWNAGACTLAPEDSPWLRVRPKKGSAVLFYSLHPDNTLDALSVHGSCPVLKGKKTVLQQWLSTKWMQPIYSPGMQALWRNPSFNRDSPGSVDASGRQWTLQRPLEDAAHGAVDGICSARGILRDSQETHQWSISFMVALETCSPKSSVRLLLEASRPRLSAARAIPPALWDLVIQDCKLTV
jgi:hypothetical protein